MGRSSAADQHGNNDIKHFKKTSGLSSVLSFTTVVFLISVVFYHGGVSHQCGLSPRWCLSSVWSFTTVVSLISVVSHHGGVSHQYGLSSRWCLSSVWSLITVMSLISVVFHHGGVSHQYGLSSRWCLSPVRSFTTVVSLISMVFRQGSHCKVRPCQTESQGLSLPGPLSPLQGAVRLVLEH